MSYEPRGVIKASLEPVEWSMWLALDVEERTEHILIFRDHGLETALAVIKARLQNYQPKETK